MRLFVVMCASLRVGECGIARQCICVCLCESALALRVCVFVCVCVNLYIPLCVLCVCVCFCIFRGGMVSQASCSACPASVKTPKDGHLPTGVCASGERTRESERKRK